MCQSDPEHTAVILKPFIPLIVALTRDKESFEIGYKAHMVLTFAFDRCPSLVPEAEELGKLIESILLSMTECMVYEKDKRFSSTPSDLKWTETLNSLEAAFMNASKVYLRSVLRVEILNFEIIFFSLSKFKGKSRRKAGDICPFTLLRKDDRRQHCLLLYQAVLILRSKPLVCCWPVLLKIVISLC